MEALGELGALLRQLVTTRRDCDAYEITEETPANVRQLVELCKRHHHTTNNDSVASWTLGAVAAELGDDALAKFLFKRVMDSQPPTTLIHLNAKYRYGTLLFDDKTSDTTKEGLAHIEWISTIDPSSYRKTEEGDGMLDAQAVLVAAQYNLGCAYHEGVGVHRDIAEAVKWWTAAACDGRPEGSVDAMHKLGDHYSRPVLVDLGDPLVLTETDFREAFSWYSCARAYGHIPSICDLGLLYRDGKGCRKNQEEALKLLREAGDAGHDVAEAALAEHYYHMGLFNKCVQWALRVAEPFLEGGESTESYNDVDEAELQQWRARACWYLAQCVRDSVGKSSLPAPLPWKTYFDVAKALDEATVTELEKARVLQRH